MAAALDAAEPVAALGAEAAATGKPPRKDPAAHGEGSAARARMSRHDAESMYVFPEGCPVEPLGKYGTTFYYLDAAQQLIPLAADKHGRAYIYALFGSDDAFLIEEWGKRDAKGGLKGGFHADDVANVLMRRCGELGIINPAKTVRGVGAWADASGHLVLHMGDRVWIDGEYRNPGRYGEHVYPAMPPTMRPSPVAESGDAAGEVLSLLRTWHWKHPLMPMLVLGWIAQGFVAGAVKWRTHMHAGGERGSGKSSLQAMIAGLYGSWLLTASDTTPAALFQLMAARAQPVFIDEFEAGDNPKRKAAIVQVLRQASSGGEVLRGGDTGIGKSFSVQFPGFLTSIVGMPMLAQDESRFARAELLPLKDHPDGAHEPPNLTPAVLAKLGSRLMRRMVDQWPRFENTLAFYRETLEELGGFDARAQDSYGTLLACADLALYDGLDTSEDSPIDALCSSLARMVAPARAEALEDQDRCLAHLLQSQVDRGGGFKRSVASWCRQAALVARSDMGSDLIDPKSGIPLPAAEAKEAAGALGSVGLKLERDKDGGRWLVVGNNHPALVRIFADTPWPGQVGTTGAWVSTLRRVTDAAPTDNMRLGGVVQRGTRVPIADIVDWFEE